MANKKPKTVLQRRKREGKTDYKKRLHLLLAKKPRLVIRTTTTKIIVQIIDFKPVGDVVLVDLSSTELKKKGWNHSYKNIPAAYLTGYLVGKKALEKNIKKAILDLGFKSPIKGNKIYACLKGVIDAGIEIPHSPEIFPSEERLTGKHIEDYKDNKITETFKKIKSEL
tara:strand:- start:233 stop:736 length:504 start_codon:yes stop_codon:yes gene_type:complete